MEKEKIQEVFLITVCEQFNKNSDEVSLGDRFNEKFGADSLDLIELIMACEDTFGISISDEEAEKIVTVEEAIDYLDEKINSKGRE